MKRIRSLGLLLAVLCPSWPAQGQAPPMDVHAVEEAAQRFVDHSHDFDYEALRAAATSDFEMSFAGTRMDLDGFEAMLREREEARDGRPLNRYGLVDFKTDIVGSVAYATWLSDTGSWLEGTVFVWSGDRWLADRAWTMRTPSPDR